jgi:membrane protease YdiL (CAAX protease family)
MADSAKSGFRHSENQLAARLRGFGPVGILAVVLILLGNFIFIPLSALLVLWWRHLSQTSWRAIGFVRPRSWIRTIAVGILFGALLKFTMKAVVMPLLGADPINQAYRHLTGNRAAIPMALYGLIIGAGFGEETLFRGYFFERFGRLFGSGVIAKIAIVLITSIVFGLAHYSGQGLTGVEQATIVGLVFGGIFAITGQIFVLMIAHAAFDLTAYAMIYWSLETRIAHLIFK